jgi:hypothetical protein
VRPFFSAEQLVQRIQIGLGRCDDDIGIRTLAIDDAAIPAQAHGHLALGIGTGGDVVDRIEQQVEPLSTIFSIARKEASTGPPPTSSAAQFIAAIGQHDAGHAAFHRFPSTPSAKSA